VPQNIEIRHNLYSIIWLYGDEVHPQVTEIITTIKEIMELIAVTSTPEELQESFTQIIKTLERQSAVGDAVEVPVDMVTVKDPPSSGKEDLGKSEQNGVRCISLRKEGNRSENPVNATWKSWKSISDGFLPNWSMQDTLDAMKAMGNSVFEPLKRKPVSFVPTISVATVKQTDTTNPHMQQFLNARKAFHRSMETICAMLSQTDKFFNGFVCAGELTEENKKESWNSFKENSDGLLKECENFVLMRPNQERVLFSLNDQVTDVDRKRWLEILSEAQILEID
jgi:hypothetical protein